MTLSQIQKRALELEMASAKLIAAMRLNNTTPAQRADMIEKHRAIIAHDIYNMIVKDTSDE